MDAPVPKKPKTEIVSFAENQKNFGELRELLQASQDHMNNFESNVNSLCEFKNALIVAGKRIAILEENHKKHTLNLSKSLQTLETNASVVFDGIFEKKMPEIKKNISTESSTQLLPLIERLTEAYTQHSAEIADLKAKLLSIEVNKANLQNINNINTTIDKITKNIANLDLKYETVIKGQNTHNLSMQEKVNSLTQQFEDLKDQKLEVKTTAFDTQINSLQNQITFLKRIIGVGLTLFAGWYLWFQIQKAEV